ncbi:EAL domain-containing protein [Litorilituus lipolyticus]|uniref:GGDEF domain-containing protein n=1 Tax=Litorilituus lipolyticus TaxID=2491017 RepID=A0A502KWD5_9GAMM|nr:GGDEF domain-containing protein [Litorilituus lipolyticus]TPH13993.1 GGDEF domain-containing protein [Litorilituus lipolyticus]
MFKFSKLLLKNTLIALVFYGVISSISLLLLKSTLAEQNNNHASTIGTLVDQASFNIASQKETLEDEKAIAKQLLNTLKKASKYQYIAIKNKASNLQVYKSNNNALLSFTYPENNNISTGKLPYTIEYTLDFTSETILIERVLTVLALLSVIFIFLATWFNYRLQAVVFNMISSQIKHDLDAINHPNAEDNDANSYIDIPALKEGIAEIKEIMSEQLRSSTHLEIEAYVDSLTELENRNRFVQVYEKYLEEDSAVTFGVLIIIRCSELQTINQVHGYKEGDDYIIQVSERLKKSLIKRPRGKLFRLNSSDFAIILPNEKIKQAEEFADELTMSFNEYQQLADLDSVAFSGLVFFDKTKPLGELLALADTGVSVAQTKSTNSWYTVKDVDILHTSTANTGNQNWRQEIDSVLEGKRISLLLQPIQPSGRNSKVYGEVLARFLNSSEDMLPTASFIAMAEKLDKIVEVDRLIIETAISEITSKNIVDQSFGINISARSISDEHFMIWLERKLLREPSVAPRLVFEITEFGLQQNIKTGKRLIEMLHRVGARVTVERFGVGLTSFKFFRDLTPDYIKMDSSYTRDIDDDKNNQYFLRLMVDLAHRLGINVLAESVETQEEKHTLEKLFIDGCQGFYVGKPAPF